jgi:hypothetical protein
LKSYQAWHYRRWLVDRLPGVSDEIPLLTATFSIDAKNFHAWTENIWYAERWNKYVEVFDVAKREVLRNCRNNSAWTVRMTLGEVLNVDPVAELSDAVASLRIVGKNEAACNFILGIVQRHPDLREKVRPLAEELIAQKPHNRFVLGLLLSVTAEQAEIDQICDSLIELDPVRTPYYTLVKQGIIKASI